MGAALVKIPQLANQNLTLDSAGKPRLKEGSPAAKAKKRGRQVAAGVPSPFGKAAPSKFLNPKYKNMVFRTKGPWHNTTTEVYARTGRAKNFFYDPKHTRTGSREVGDLAGAEGSEKELVHWDNQKFKGRPTAGGIAGVGGAGAVAGGVALGNRRGKSSVNKALTDTQLQKRKRISADTAIVTSTLGLGALAAHGGGAAARRLGAGKRLLHIPGTGHKNPGLMRTGRKIQNAAVPVSLTSGGISGAAGYNYAGIQREEARRKQGVSKDFRSDEPKVRAYQRHYVNINTKTGAWAHSIDPHDAVQVEHKGTSALRRRPKYDVTFVQAKGVRHNSRTGVATGESTFPSRIRTNKKTYKQLGAIAAGKGDTGTVNGHTIKVVRKAYDPERNRFRRNRVGEPVSFAAGGAALGGAGYLGHRAATKETRDVRTGKASFDRAKTSASKTEAGYSAAQIARETSATDVKRAKHTLGQMEQPPDPTKTYTPEQVNRRLANLKSQQDLVARHEKAHFDAGQNESKLKELIPKKHASAKKAAQGLKTLRRVRRISATKAGALGVLGTGGIAGGMYLHRVPRSTSTQSYSGRYRPGQS
jgi:hypothetical protein